MQDEDNVFMDDDMGGSELAGSGPRGEHAKLAEAQAAVAGGSGKGKMQLVCQTVAFPQIALHVHHVL